MLDVHPPHHPATNVKDLVVHLVTITIGLFIALSIEGCIDWRHHVHVAGEARAMMRAEIGHNESDLQTALPIIKKERAAMDTNLAYVNKVQANPGSKDAQHGSLSAEFKIIGLRETAWRAAQSSGALGYMPYDEAQRYSGVYEAQQKFLASQNVVMSDYARFIGQLYKSNMFGDKDMTADQAAGFAEAFRVWKAHLMFVDLYLQESAAYDDALLHNKTEPGGFHEELH